MDSVNEKYSVKNLLFTKAIPNYVIPVPTNGHKVFSCSDCGDKFILEASLDYHLNRKSVQISYMCRNCNDLKVFYNRCNLLSHIRSHAFKTATINVTDLKVEPLPLNFFVKDLTPCNAEQGLSSGLTTHDQCSTSQMENTRKQKFVKSTCHECQEDITDSGVVYKDRAKHYMQYSKSLHSCPICMVALPTNCAMKAHLRIHLKCPPYYCPECGIYLQNKSVFYPYIHDCEGFKMMRATARVKCTVADCHLLHPNEFREHLKNNHLKKVYKCPFCFVACFNEPIMTKHLKTHNSEFESKASIFYQCEMCPGRLVLQNQIENHIKTHINGSNMYPCWSCGTIFKDIPFLIEHHIEYHSFPRSFLIAAPDCKTKRIYRVVKRCDQCKRSFTYKCKYNQIKMLPTECPYKCSSTRVKQSTEANNETLITCHLCKLQMSEKWEDITNHYAENHPIHRCLNIKVLLTKLDLTKYKNFKTPCNKKLVKASKQKKNTKRKLNLRTVKIIDQCDSRPAGVDDGETKQLDELDFHCSKCNFECDSKQHLERHMVQHRDPCMAYQCLECGQSFVVKPSFSKHLLLEHGISNVEDYIDSKQCYNENALLKYQYLSMNNEPLHENQCNICREQFDSSDHLEKHFRVHGMAFLMKNNSLKNNSP